MGRGFARMNADLNQKRELNSLFQIRVIRVNPRQIPH
jgi:hypothetical protein